MKRDIRKISVGNGHPDQMMHYQIGKEYNLQGRKYHLSNILLEPELFSEGKLAYNLYLRNDDGTVCWKTLVDVPMVIEYNINFD